MGKGDIKTKKGKISNQSFGRLRKHKTKTDKPQDQDNKEEKQQP